jgi:hypothetical protein
VPLDFLSALEPVAQMHSGPWWLVVPGDSPFNTLEEFITFAKENPGEIVVANSGNLAIGHLPTLELERLAEVEFTHLPFDGGGPAYAAVLSGDADAVHGVTAGIVNQVRSGNFKALAVTGNERNPELPDVPTFAEQGYPINVGINIGLVAPAGTPPEVIAYLEEAMKKISRSRPAALQVLEAPGAARRVLLFAVALLLAALPSEIYVTARWTTYLEAMRTAAQADRRLMAFDDTPLARFPNFILGDDLTYLADQLFLLRSKPDSRVIVVRHRKDVATTKLPRSPPYNLGGRVWGRGAGSITIQSRTLTPPNAARAKP